MRSSRIKIIQPLIIVALSLGVFISLFQTSAYSISIDKDLPATANVVAYTGPNQLHIIGYDFTGDYTAPGTDITRVYLGRLMIGEDNSVPLADSNPGFYVIGMGSPGNRLQVRATAQLSPIEGGPPFIPFSTTYTTPGGDTSTDVFFGYTVTDVRGIPIVTSPSGGAVPYTTEFSDITPPGGLPVSGFTMLNFFNYLKIPFDTPIGSHGLIFQTQIVFQMLL